MRWLKQQRQQARKNQCETDARVENTDRDKMARLERAESEVKDLRGRADRAIGKLDARHSRNHWRESITEMIQGV